MKKYNMKFSSAIVYMIPTLFYLVIAIMFFYEAKTIADFRDNSSTVKGILLETDRKYNEDDELRYYGKYEYEVDGQKYSVWSKYGEDRESNLYKETSVYYDDRNPKDSRIEIDTEYIHRNIFMGALFLVGAAIVAYLDYRLIIKSII